jgi:type III secretion protein V
MASFASTAATRRPGTIGALFSTTFGSGRTQDVLLATLAVAVISLMVLPLPPALLDTLIAINIGLSVLLLMMSMYVPSPLALSTFPTLLLFTTLLRLSLNIASTRAILLHAHAGQIIDTFGKLVVGGNLVVGVVVFLIIAIVQFIVIAKGAERVAEVGARFTLDALPGKQMSIDAELRAGIIDKDESRAKREMLQRESQLYGAMDGAMKFVKGDAIAGLLIALVNILAGISIGMAMNGMPFALAASTYSILTIGDGLVSQIPSLFVSLAAGVLITRVHADESKPQPSLSSEIGAQLTSQPKALLVTALVMFMFMWVPGFPKAQFLGWAALLGGGGWWLWRQTRNRRRYDPMSGHALHRDGIARPRTGIDIEHELITSYAVALRVSPTLMPLLESGALNDEVARTRRLVTRKLGLPFPGVAISADDSVPNDHYLFLVNEIPVASGVIVPGGLYAQLPPAKLRALGAVPLLEAAPGLRAEGAWVAADHEAALDAGSVRWLSGARFLGQALAGVLTRNAAEFVGLQEVKYLLSETEKAFPDLVAEAERAVPLTRLTDVLKRLVQEDVSVRNMRDILQALIEWSPKEKDAVPLTEYVRNTLARQITYQYGGVAKLLHGVLLSQQAEELIRTAIRMTPAGNYLALEPERTSAMTQRIGEIAAQAKRPPGAVVVVVVSMDIRRYVKRMIEPDLPDLPVISYQDLAGDARVHSVGRLDNTEAIGSAMPSPASDAPAPERRTMP